MFATSLTIQRQAAVKAADLRDVKIDIDLMHMGKHGARFRLDRFYKDIITVEVIRPFI
jgi:hypothetical protein